MSKNLKQINHYLIIMLFLSTFVSFAQAGETQKVMDRVFSSFSTLLPYISSEMKFTDPSSTKIIKKNISILKDSFKKVKHIQFLQTSGFSITGHLINETLEDSYENFNQKNYFFARKRLVGMTSLCINCHAQLNPSKGILGKKTLTLKEQDFDNIFSYAEYLYLIRDYKKSIAAYKSAIENRVKKNKSLTNISYNMTFPEKDIRQSLIRMVSVYTKVDFKPKKALLVLSKYQEDKAFSKFLRADITNWRKELTIWSQSNIKLANLGMNKFVASYLAPLEKKTSFEDGKHDILLLLSSGVLLRDLQTLNNSNDYARALYWLGVIESHLSHNLFYSLSDSYFLECINKYPKTKMAKKCYLKYEENIKIGYSGSSGLHLPEDVKKKLSNLKKMLK